MIFADFHNREKSGKKKKSGEMGKKETKIKIPSIQHQTRHYPVLLKILVHPNG